MAKMSCPLKLTELLRPAYAGYSGTFVGQMTCSLPSLPTHCISGVEMGEHLPSLPTHCISGVEMGEHSVM